MTSTAEEMRAWRGPALLAYGFRPFFFGAGAWAVVAMALWVPMLSGLVALPTLSGLAWIAALGGFSVLYGRHLLRARPEH